MYKLSNGMKSFGHSDRIVHDFTFYSRLYRVQQKGSKLLTTYFWCQNGRMEVQHRHSKRDSFRVPEVCVSQKSRKQVL